MTEQEWLTATDPYSMLKHLHHGSSDRKRRLLCVACCQRKWKYFRDERARAAVTAAELYADDDATLGDLDGVRQRIRRAFVNVRDERGARAVETRVALVASYMTSSRPQGGPILDVLARIPVDSDRARKLESIAHAELLRDIVGNPFRPVAADPAWLTPTVVGLADGVYADRAFDRLPVLADALEEAGCEQPDLLAHLRGPGPHVRGCWAVDLLLGKT